MNLVVQADKPGLIKEKLYQVHELLKTCELCEHRCLVDRIAGKVGRCGATDRVYVHSEFLHFGIEYDLIPSYAIFFSGCSMRCVFCSSLKGLNPTHGIPLDAKSIAQRIDDAADDGAKTVLFVGGEPTIHPQGILEIAFHCKSKIPFIMDTNLYMTEPVFDLLEGVVGIYLADFKFGNDHCAQRLAGITRYMATLQRNMSLAQSHADLYIRHVLMPGHLECCYYPVANWIYENMPEAKFHLVDSYEPAYLWQKKEELQRKISENELIIARQYALNLHLNLVR